MATDGSFLVEEFLGAIASQLDRTQDALALKTVNRPLTYAIKDFTMELKVFVELDADGKVRFRSPGSNEVGASSVHLGFTTITRPMIEENTTSLALTRGPTLAEAGLSEPERRRLEQLGVRTTGELARLRTQTGTAGMARLSDVSAERLLAALQFGRPVVSGVHPMPPPGAPRPPAPPARPPASQPPRPRPTPTPPGSGPVIDRPPPRPRPAPRPQPPRPLPQRPPSTPPPRSGGPIRVPPATRRLELSGRNMLAAGDPPQLRLDGRPLAIAEADDARLVVELPAGEPIGGTLEIDYGDGAVTSYELESGDPWAPEEA